MAVTTRYSDEDLALFKAHITEKLNRSQEEYNFILSQIENTSESMEAEGDRMDDSSYSNDLELLYTMVSRSRKHIRDLENALLRIQNKSYGICIVTGELIDKRRLLAVPTTSKSLIAKNGASLRKEKEKPVKRVITHTPKVISKVVNPSNLTEKKVASRNDWESSVSQTLNDRPHLHLDDYSIEIGMFSKE